MAYNDHDADDRYPGSMKKRAKKAGKDMKAFAEANIHTDGPVGKLARLYYTMQDVHGSGKSNMGHAGDTRSMGQKLYQMG